MSYVTLLNILSKSKLLRASSPGRFFIIKMACAVAPWWLSRTLRNRAFSSWSGGKFGAGFRARALPSKNQRSRNFRTQMPCITPASSSFSRGREKLKPSKAAKVVVSLWCCSRRQIDTVSTVIRASVGNKILYPFCGQCRSPWKKRRLFLGQVHEHTRAWGGSEKFRPPESEIL